MTVDSWAQYQTRPHRPMITGPTYFRHLAGPAGIRNTEASGEDVIPGEPCDRGTDVPGGPGVALPLEVAPDALAVEVPSDDHGTGRPGRIGEDRIRLALAIAVGRTYLGLQMHRIDPKTGPPHIDRGGGSCSPLVADRSLVRQDYFASPDDRPAGEYGGAEVALPSGVDGARVVHVVESQCPRDPLGARFVHFLKRDDVRVPQLRGPEDLNGAIDLVSQPDVETDHAKPGSRVSRSNRPGV
jgi:hypothetical protein